VGYDVSPPASWVKPLNPDEISMATSTEVEGGVDYLLIDTTPIQINTANFAFTENSAVNNHTIHFNYHYRTLAADVLPANIGYYNQQINKVRQRLQRGLTLLPGMELGSPGTYRPNWIGFINFWSGPRVIRLWSQTNLFHSPVNKINEPGNTLFIWLQN